MTNTTEYRNHHYVSEKAPTLRERESKRYKKELMKAKLIVKFKWIFKHTGKLAKARIILSRDDMVDLGLKEGETRYNGAYGSVIKSKYSQDDDWIDVQIEDIMEEFREIFSREVEIILKGLSYDELKSLEIEINNLG